MATSAYERRIGGRAPVGPVEITIVVTERARRRLGGVRARLVEAGAFLMDVSVTGAGIIAPAVEGVGLLAPLTLRASGRETRAVVRRLERLDDGRVFYGVDFPALDPAMREYLFSLLEQQRPSGLEEYWLHSP
jgi:hypothetical protein